MNVILKNLGFVCLVCLTFACASAEKTKITKEQKAKMLVDIANGALVEGDATGALANLLEAESLDPKLPEVYQSKALAFYAKNDLKLAIESAKKAVQLSPKYADANNTLGKLLIDANRYSEAEPYLKAAADDHLNRESYKAKMNLGILYYRQADLVRSQTYLSLAIRDAPLVACVAYYYRGHIHMKRGKFEESIRDYEHASKNYCGAFTEAHYALGVAFAENKQSDRARKKFLEIKQLYPESKLAEKAAARLRTLP